MTRLSDILFFPVLDDEDDGKDYSTQSKRYNGGGGNVVSFVTF
jgi:hypothetical protein